MTATDGNFLAAYLPYLLRQADQTLSAPFYALLSQYGIARSEWRVLVVLDEVGELSVADLANEALSPQPTVTHAIRRLEKQNLVARTPGKTDKRQRFISITAAGSKLTTTLMTEAKRLEADLIADAGDLSELVDQLQRLTASVAARAQMQPDEASHAG